RMRLVPGGLAASIHLGGRRDRIDPQARGPAFDRKAEFRADGPRARYLRCVSAFADPEHELEPREVARRMREDGWLVVDVREPYEREAGRIAGTRHIELERLAARAQTIPRDRPVVFQCRLGARAGLATRAFRPAGWG